MFKLMDQKILMNNESSTLDHLIKSIPSDIFAIIWVISRGFGTYHIAKQRSLRRAAHSCSIVRAYTAYISQRIEEADVIYKTHGRKFKIPKILNF